MTAPYALRASVALEPGQPGYRLAIDQTAVDEMFWQIVAAALEPPPIADVPGPADASEQSGTALVVPTATARRFPSERSPPPRCSSH